MQPLRLDDFHYDLPQRLIAQAPADPPDSAALMVASAEPGDNPRAAQVARRCFRDLPDALRPGDVLVYNDTRVVPARLLLRRPTGGRIDALLLGPFDGARCPAMTRGASRVREGEILRVENAPGVEAGRVKAGGAEAFARVVERHPQGARPGTLLLEFSLPPGMPALSFFLEQYGNAPLPPYIKRSAENPRGAEDRRRYQSMFAAHDGSVAAPTASLHFTPSMVEQLRERGVRMAPVTLHVGPGTFLPVETEDPRQHRMHAEWYNVEGETAAELARAAGDRRRVIAVGTTALRAVEGAWRNGAVQPGSGWVELFILPGYRFRVAQGLVTNFHLPRSTLLMLASAFFGLPRLLGLYREAIRQGLRFYSFGDGMLLWRPGAAK